MDSQRMWLEMKKTTLCVSKCTFHEKIKSLLICSTNYSYKSKMEIILIFLSIKVVTDEWLNYWDYFFKNNFYFILLLWVFFLQRGVPAERYLRTTVLVQVHKSAMLMQKENNKNWQWQPVAFTQRPSLCSFRFPSEHIMNLLWMLVNKLPQFFCYVIVLNQTHLPHLFIEPIHAILKVRDNMPPTLTT